MTLQAEEISNEDLEGLIVAKLVETPGQPLAGICTGNLMARAAAGEFQGKGQQRVYRLLQKLQNRGKVFSRKRLWYPR